MSWPITEVTIKRGLDEMLSRSDDATLAALIYQYLPKIAPFGRELPKGGIYYDSNYDGSNGVSDGTEARPYVTLNGINVTAPSTIHNFKRGSVWYAPNEGYSMIQISAPNVQIRYYGDDSKPLPLITALQKITTAWTTVGSGATLEYVTDLPLTLAPNCMAIAFGHLLPNVLINGTVGSLKSGEAAWAANKLYVKDNPAGREVFASVRPNVLVVRASGFRNDGVNVGYSHNNPSAYLPVSGKLSDIVSRDAGTFYGGNNGVGASDATNVIQIRPRDIGSFNNGVSTIGDDSYWLTLEGHYTGMTRLSGVLIPGTLTGGYTNDGITAHGTGLGWWHAIGCTVTNAFENGIDIIGGARSGNINIHKDSLKLFNRVDNCYEPGILMWAYGAKAIGNDITNCGQDGIRAGDENDTKAMMSQEVAYNFMSGNCTNGIKGGACGISFIWGDVYAHHNTIVMTSKSTRSFFGGMDITTGQPNSHVGARGIENNILIRERDDIASLTFSNSNGDFAKWNFKGNVLIDVPPIIPSASPVPPIKKGSTLVTTAQWQSANEPTCRSYIGLQAAGLVGPRYVPAIDSPLATGTTYSAPAYDLRGRFAMVGVGASAPEAVPQSVAPPAVSVGYFTHCYAPAQLATDVKLFDLFGAADGTFGANLTAAAAWANAGYVSTLDPATGTLDSGIALPALGWDWQGGESLLVFWRGSVTPEGAATAMMGQAGATFAASQRGPEFRVLTTGQVQLVCNDGTQLVLGPVTPDVAGQRPFVSGEEHSFGMALDPIARVARLYVDGEFVVQTALASLNLLNTTAPFRVGSSAPTPVVTNGIATKTRALVVLKGRYNRALPSSINLTMRRLHRNPGALLSGEAW